MHHELGNGIPHDIPGLLPPLGMYRNRMKEAVASRKKAKSDSGLGRRELIGLAQPIGKGLLPPWKNTGASLRPLP
jgi:hypothetical protein